MSPTPQTKLLLLLACQKIIEKSGGPFGYCTRPLIKVCAFKRSPYSMDVCGVLTYGARNLDHLYFLIIL